MKNTSRRKPPRRSRRKDRKVTANLPGSLFLLTVLITSAAIVAIAHGSDTVTIEPGQEASISTALNGGHNVALVAGGVYTLSASEQIKINGSGVDLNGNGATLHLDNTFNNFSYNPLQVHGDVNGGAPNPKTNAFAIYIGTNASGVSVRNLKIERDPVSGSVVRSIAVVKSSDVRIQNVEITGNTIGPIIDIVDSDNVTVVDSNIHDSIAEDKAHKLDLSGAGKPNLTGIQVDDVDLLQSGNQRKDESLHSLNLRILNNQIKNFKTDPSIFDAMAAQLGITDTAQQTDGINLQRGFNYKILNNVIVNTDEGIDTFGYHGLIRDNTIKLNPLTEASAALKFIHGASHNLAVSNTIINRKISSIFDSSTFTNLTGSQGTFGNALIGNYSVGSGDKLHRISRAAGAPGPEKNFILKNTGGKNSSDFTSNDPNILFASANEPTVVLMGNFDDNAYKDDIALYFKATGKTDIYYRTQSEGFDNYVMDTKLNGICESEGSACPDYNKNLTYAFTGNFFADAVSGNPDDFLFMTIGSSSSVDRFHRNSGNRTYSQYSYELEPPGGIPASLKDIVVGDFNGDGKTDVFLRAADGSSRLYRNDDNILTTGKLEFTRLSNPIPPTEIRDESSTNPVIGMRTADFNADGKTDLLWLWKSGKTLIKLGDSTLQFAGKGQVTSNFGAINNMTNPDDVQVFDYNQDGYDDVLLKLGNDTRRLFQCDSGCGSGNLTFSYKNTIF